MEKSIENLWFVMHHSMDPSKEVLAVNCYMDESATDGSTAQAVVAGVLFNRDGFLSFDTEWRAFIKTRKLAPALHVAKFPRRPIAEKSAIFADAVKLINDHKIYSIAATIKPVDYRKFLDPRIRRRISVYGLCFILSTYESHLMAAQNGYTGEIGFILDAGNPYASHVRGAHAEILKRQESEQFNVGSLTFGDDKKITALQAADAVAWSVRRRLVGMPFNHGHGPLASLFDDAHVEHSWDIDMLRSLDSGLMRIADKTNQNGDAG